MKFLGIDYGTKRVGIALSDDLGHLAFPYRIIPRDTRLVEKIKEICAKEGVGTIVIGESRDFKGRENPIMPAVRALKETLERETGLPVHLEPEMLTTQEARRPHSKPEKTRKPRKREDADASAAALILQSFLDRQKVIP